MMLARLFRVLFLLVAGLMLAAPALAQQPSGPAKNPFGDRSERNALARPAAEPPSEAGIFQRMGTWVLSTQRKISNDLAQTVLQLKSTNPLGASLMLGLLSFAYGVLHAAGPGHGKAVISSYVLADGRTIRRGVLLAFLAAFVQALSALALVAVLLLVLRTAGSQTRLVVEAWLETASWALVALVGAWLLYDRVRAIVVSRMKAKAPAHDHAHAHLQHDHAHQPQRELAHAHAHAGSHHAHGHHHHHHHHDHAPGHAGHDHAHDHAHGDDCEMCAHLPDPQQLKGDWSWKHALALAFAIGIRPCTGAILVLVFAIGQGLLWAGVFSTFAMAIGTAITVSALAAGAVGIRNFATRIAGRGNTALAENIQLFAGLAGALLVLGMGVLFFFASLGPAKPF